jgi:TPR repeat protein
LTILPLSLALRIGIIKSYCQEDVKEGVELLKWAALKGYVRAAYALGLVLRDTDPKTSLKYMQAASDYGYVPALQEILSPRKMKEKYGEPNANELQLHLDPLCLNRLLNRYYIQTTELRAINTSHCWNPLCGRWAHRLLPPCGNSMAKAGLSVNQQNADVRVSRMM